MTFETTLQGASDLIWLCRDGRLQQFGGPLGDMVELPLGSVGWVGWSGVWCGVGCGGGGYAGVR